MKTGKLLINSTMIFVFAFTVTTLFHEFGHFISYYFFDANPVLFHNAVHTSNKDLSLIAKIISALAGPVFSLTQGVLFLVICHKRQKNKIIDLVMLWLGVFGIINFFGYLMMTPFSTAGDTGKVAELLNFSYFIRVAIAIIGLVLLLFIISGTAKIFINFLPETTGKKEKVKYAYAILFLPIIFGSIINAILSFPIPVVLSVIYPATSSFVVMMIFGKILRFKSNLNLNKNSFLLNKVSIPILLLLILIVIINRILVYGFHL